ncbi:uncharacterized protein [Penaeus vannamei]|uniref:uncharacterized protein n=1 Tax=Penaeus vannamei TaxID=6689 RepID=UPI00387F4249
MVKYLKILVDHFYCFTEKKPGAIECELHLIISLMSHIMKLILRIIMARARNEIKFEISEVPCGFVEDAGTRNAIFMIRMLSERAIEMQKDLYVCFIDYTKAFDKVQHAELLKMLETLDLDGKDIRLIRNLYWEQTACMRVENQLTESQEKLQDLLDKVVDASRKKEMTNKRKETECMVVSKHTSPPCELKIEQEKIKKVQKFNYLGSMVSDDGRCDTEIRKRIGIAKDTFQKLGTVFKDRRLGSETKVRVLDCYVNSVLLYGSECWTISAQMEKRLEATEMRFFRRMLQISWTDHVTIQEIL